MRALRSAAEEQRLKVEEIHKDKVAWLTLEKGRLKSLKCRLTAQRARCDGEVEEGKDAVGSGRSISRLRGNRPPCIQLYSVK